MLCLTGFNSELLTIYKEPMQVFCTQSVLTIIPLFGIIILIWSLYLIFVQEMPHPEVIFSFYVHYTITWWWPIKQAETS
jgi:hypothetical protein